MDLLSALTDQWRSGEDLASQLDVSRAAVSKAAGVLASAGVPVEVERASGYRLRPGTPTSTAVHAARAPDAAGAIGADYRYVGEVTSTQDELRAWAEDGATTGSVLLAERQTQGRGRRGRTWTSSEEPGLGLTFSALLRPHAVAHLPLLPLAAGVALARACDLGTHVKWPNDLLAPDGRKVAGILVEARTLGDEVAYALVGIGINVDAPAPAGGAALNELDPPSVRSRVEVLANVLIELERQSARLEAGETDAILSDWSEHSRMFGAPVRIHGASGVVHGIARRLDTSGGLIVESSEGGGAREVLVTAGDVEMIDRR